MIDPRTKDLHYEVAEWSSDSLNTGTLVRIIALLEDRDLAVKCLWDAHRKWPDQYLILSHHKGRVMQWAKPGMENEAP